MRSRFFAKCHEPLGERVLTNVAELKLGELRRLVGSVSQFPLYLEAPVRENLRLACPNASESGALSAQMATPTVPRGVSVTASESPRA